MTMGVFCEILLVKCVISQETYFCEICHSAQITSNQSGFVIYIGTVNEYLCLVFLTLCCHSCHHLCHPPWHPFQSHRFLAACTVDLLFLGFCSGPFLLICPFPLSCLGSCPKKSSLAQQRPKHKIV